MSSRPRMATQRFTCERPRATRTRCSVLFSPFSFAFSAHGVCSGCVAVEGPSAASSGAILGVFPPGAAWDATANSSRLPAHAAPIPPPPTLRTSPNAPPFLPPRPSRSLPPAAPPATATRRSPPPSSPRAPRRSPSTSRTASPRPTGAQPSPPPRERAPAHSFSPPAAFGSLLSLQATPHPLRPQGRAERPRRGDRRPRRAQGGPQRREPDRRHVPAGRGGPGGPPGGCPGAPPGRGGPGRPPAAAAAGGGLLLAPLRHRPLRRGALSPAPRRLTSQTLRRCSGAKHSDVPHA